MATNQQLFTFFRDGAISLPFTFKKGLKLDLHICLKLSHDLLFVLICVASQDNLFRRTTEVFKGRVASQNYNGFCNYNGISY